MSPPVPTVLGSFVGEYEIVAELGAGGMGVVYEGRHPGLGRRVAVKVLRRGAGADETEASSRFLAEARAVNAIRHRGLVDIFAFGTLIDGTHYLVMEYLEGLNFEQLVARRAPVEVGEALQWLEEALDALGAAHRAGIVHRDLKPSNLFLVEPVGGRPYVKVLDFGIAKAVQGEGLVSLQTSDSVIIGTPNYMSPEQAQGLPVSPASDLYSIGLVLFELLTGRKAFEGDTAVRTMWMHVREPPPFAADLNVKVPAGVDDVVQWLLAKDPRQRPGSAEGLRETLRSLRLSGQDAAPAAPPGTPSVDGPSVAAAPIEAGPEAAKQRSRRARARASRVAACFEPTDRVRAARPPSRRAWALFTALAVVGLAMGVGLRALRTGPPGSSGAEAPPQPAESAAAAPPTPRKLSAVVLRIEEPAQGATMSGIGAVRGWAVGRTGVERVELFLDGQRYGRIAYGGKIPDVKSLFLGNPTAAESGFAMAFNYSELTPGAHTLLLRATGKDGDSGEARATFNVVRFHNSYLSRPQEVSVARASLRGVGSTVEVKNLMVGGVAYDAVLGWAPDLQDFTLSEIATASGATAAAPVFSNPAAVDGAPLGLGVASPALGRSAAPSGTLRWSVEEPQDGEVYTGFALFRGWALMPVGTPVVRVTISGLPKLTPAFMGLRPDVARAHADIAGAANSGFSMGVHWSRFGAGTYRVETQIRGLDGSHGGRQVTVRVVRFENPLMAAPDAVRLDDAAFTKAGHEFRIRNLLAEGKPYDVRLTWRPSVQRFTITDIAPGAKRAPPALLRDGGAP